MTNEVKIRGDVPLSLHPDQAAPWRAALDIDATVGQSVYRLARELSAGLYNATAAMQDAIRAVSATVDGNGPRVMTHATPKSAGKGAGVRVLSGREPELREGMSAAFDRAAKDADRRYEQVTKTIEAIQKRVDAALKFAGEDSPSGIAVAGQIRDYVRGLKGSERHNFIDAHIKKGDLRVISAILGAPEFLSGLDDDARTMWRDSAAEKFAKLDHAQHRAAVKIEEHARRTMTAFVSWYHDNLPAEGNQRKNAADLAIQDLKKGVAR